MSARLASGVSICVAYGLLVGAICANGCGGSAASRTAAADAQGDSTSAGDTSVSSNEAASSDSPGTTAADSATSEGGSATACTCPFPSTVTVPEAGILYMGEMPIGRCSSSLNATNSWFGYNDGSVSADAGTFVSAAGLEGCDGPGTCAFHATGAGYTDWGAGVGFTLNDNDAFDASMFTGLILYLRGTTTGTRGMGFTQADNSVHVKFVNFSASANEGDGGDPLYGDDYGAYCDIAQDAGTCYTKCQIPFSEVYRDGYLHLDAGMPPFDPTTLAKIQFEFDLYSPATGPVPAPVGFDVWIDNVAFYK